MPQESKRIAETICDSLETRIAQYRHVVTKELRGQLLEYRRGGVVALDEEDPQDYSASVGHEPDVS